MVKVCLVLFLIGYLMSCSSMVSYNTGKKTQSSSLMSFLYPDEESRIEHEVEIPTLTLPVKVGLAFVPSKGWDKIHISDQIALLEKVKSSFLEYDYIDRIEIIPSDYLRGGEGFSTLDRVSRMYDVDVMALVSYDQATQSFENNAALLYWTIVGMYVIPGNENSIQTFVDTAVFDIKSKKMLFRAPGLNKIEYKAAAIELDAKFNQLSIEGFELAVTDMTINLDAELDRFKIRVKKDKIVKIEKEAGYTGSGAFGIFSMIFFLLLFFRSGGFKGIFGVR